MMNLREIERFLAYERARQVLQMSCAMPTDHDDEEYLESTRDLSTADMDVSSEVAYLESRGLLARLHPEHPDWVTFCDEDEPVAIPVEGTVA